MTVPHINLMLCKSIDGSVELIANLDVQVTDIAFCGLSNTPKA